MTQVAFTIQWLPVVTHLVAFVGGIVGTLAVITILFGNARFR